jgi:TfoX/Sxy family transcriptional regulator of competence genes
MAFSEALAGRVRVLLAGRPVTEKRMFGGLAFLHSGNMCCGILGEELMVRVGPEAYAEALGLAGAREMDFTGKALRGFVYVFADALARDADLEAWVGRGVAYAETLPAKS